MQSSTEAQKTEGSTEPGFEGARFKGVPVPVLPVDLMKEAAAAGQGRQRPPLSLSGAPSSATTEGGPGRSVVAVTGATSSEASSWPAPSPYDSDGYNSDGYDRKGFDRNSYDRKGYDGEGYDRKGFDRYGQDRESYNRQGFGRDGYNRQGFGRDGRDSEGYNRQGFDLYGRDRDGFGRDGYDRDGYNRQGFDRQGLPAQGATTTAERPAPQPVTSTADATGTGAERQELRRRPTAPAPEELATSALETQDTSAGGSASVEQRQPPEEETRGGAEGQRCGPRRWLVGAALAGSVAGSALGTAWLLASSCDSEREPGEQSWYCRNGTSWGR